MKPTEGLPSHHRHHYSVLKERYRRGLQAGIFTRDLFRMQRAWDEKDSGLGRKGVRYAMEDMCETRLLAIRTP